MSTQTVLIVDDQPINLQLAQAVLETDGWTVLCAADGHEMQAELSCCRPDVILMDIQMPETDGLTLTRELKADPRWRSVPVIAFTALAMRGDKARLLDEGCDGYIEKSIEVEAFSAQVRSLPGAARPDCWRRPKSEPTHPPLGSRGPTEHRSSLGSSG